MEKNKGGIQKFKETGHSRYRYLKICFQHDMAYGDFKSLPRRTASDKALYNTTFKIAKIPKYDGYQRGPTSMVYKFFDTKPATTHLGKRINFNSERRQLGEE